MQSRKEERKGEDQQSKKDSVLSVCSVVSKSGEYYYGDRGEHEVQCDRLRRKNGSVNFVPLWLSESRQGSIPGRVGQGRRDDAFLHQPLIDEPIDFRYLLFGAAVGPHRILKRPLACRYPAHQILKALF